MTLAGIRIRFAEERDAESIAAIHADSWRHHYRGAYSTRYLDGDLDSDRLTVWTERLDQVRFDRVTIVAGSAERVVGFVHVVLDADSSWGAMIENLHVTRSLHRNGLGTLLLAAAAEVVIERRPESAIYLWVQEQNKNAQSFYVSRHGLIGDREPITPPGEDPRNLEGDPCKLRVSWRDPTGLLLPA